MYSIMNLKRVEEMYRSGVEMNTEVLDIEAPKVVLANSVKLSVEERRHLVLKLVFDDEELVNKLLSFEHTNQTLIAAAIIYLCKKVQLDNEQFAALVTGMFFPHKDTYVSKQLSTNQVSRDLHIMNVLTQFQMVLEAICSINSMFGAPIDADYETILCGPQVLIQYHHELDKESPLRLYSSVILKTEIPEDFIAYSKRQKTS